MEALKQLRQERSEAGDDVSAEWLNSVVATRVMRFGTPVGTLQLLSGDHQASQASVRSLTVAEFLRLLLLEDPGLSLKDKILRCVQKSGWSRALTPV